MDVYLDFETYFDAEYSLQRMPTVLYIRDQRFQAFGVGIAIDDAPAEWHTNMDVLRNIDWRDATLVGHNLPFDAGVLFERYGIIPARYEDTRSFAALVLPRDIDRTLKAAAKYLGLGDKGDALDSLKGVRRPTTEQLAALGEYCKQDVELTRRIHQLLRPLIPERELRLMHMTTRMSARPVLQLDEEQLSLEVQEQIAKREAAIELGGFPIETLRSNDKFAVLLASLIGEENIPMKQGKKGPIPALAKNDAGARKLRADYPELAPLFDAKDEAKSNTRVTRARRFAAIAPTGAMPMPYLYYGAHSGRWSGSDGLNVQNLPRRETSRLRDALLAPNGHVIHVVDSAQIELRVQLMLSGNPNIYRLDTADLYKEDAVDIFQKDLEGITKFERQVGKVRMLGCQYGMGGAKYRLYMAGGPMGLPSIWLSEAEAHTQVMGYRERNPATVQLWHDFDAILPEMTRPDCDIQFGPVTFRYEQVLMPGGSWIDYTGLRFDEVRGGWVYGLSAIHPIWGGILTNNVVQGLARIIVAEQAIATEDSLSIECVGWTHDENLFIGAEEGADERQAAIIHIHQQSPTWWPDLPLNAEGGYARNYSK